MAGNPNTYHSVFQYLLTSIDQAVGAYKQGDLRTHYRTLNRLFDCHPFGLAAMAVYRSQRPPGSPDWRIIDNFISRQLCALTTEEVRTVKQPVTSALGFIVGKLVNFNKKTRDGYDHVLNDWLGRYQNGDLAQLPWNNFGQLAGEVVAEKAIAYHSIPFPDSIFFHYPLEMARLATQPPSKKTTFGLYNGDYLFMRVVIDEKDLNYYMLFYPENSPHPMYAVQIYEQKKKLLLTQFGFRYWKFNPTVELGVQPIGQELRARAFYSDPNSYRFKIEHSNELRGVDGSFVSDPHQGAGILPLKVNFINFGDHKWRILREFDLGRYSIEVEELLFLQTINLLKHWNENLALVAGQRESLGYEI